MLGMNVDLFRQGKLPLEPEMYGNDNRIQVQGSMESSGGPDPSC